MSRAFFRIFDALLEMALVALVVCSVAFLVYGLGAMVEP